MKKIKPLLFGAIMVICGLFVSCEKDDLSRNMSDNSATPANEEKSQSVMLASGLTQSEEDLLVENKEAEKMARDLYNAFYSKWRSGIFSHISSQEVSHMNSVISLLKKYGSSYTQVGSPGVYTLPRFQTFYSQNLSKGLTSLGNALKVGCLFEEMDIKDLRDALEVTTKQDIASVYKFLLNGSIMHLRMYYMHLRRLGLSYTPVYLTQAEFNQIVNSMGPGAGSGHDGNEHRNSGNGRMGHGR